MPLSLPYTAQRQTFALIVRVQHSDKPRSYREYHLTFILHFFSLCRHRLFSDFFIATEFACRSFILAKESNSSYSKSPVKFRDNWWTKRLKLSSGCGWSDDCAYLRLHTQRGLSGMHAASASEWLRQALFTQQYETKWHSALAEGSSGVYSFSILPLPGSHQAIHDA